MLSGAKIGKRKRKNVTHKNSHQITDIPTCDNNNRSSTSNTTNNNDGTTTATSMSSSSNQSAADELRRILLGTSSSGRGEDRITRVASRSIPTKNEASTSFSNRNFRSGQNGGGVDVGNDSNMDTRTDDVLDRLERMGKVTATSFSATESNDDAKRTILMSDSASGFDVANLKHLSKRQRKKKFTANNNTTTNDNPTIEDMISEERSSQIMNSSSMDETYARNIARLGSRYKNTEYGKRSAGATAGADEDDYTQNDIDMTLFQSRSDTPASYVREQSRQIARSKTELSITNKCWWWLESSSFRKHTLLSLGNHVTLVLMPSHRSIVEFQCCIVPIQPAESFVSCDDEVWDEVHRFRTSLRNMFRKEGKAVLFCESVLPSNGFWQTRMDVIPVPIHIEQDAPIYFKSALTEEAEEWGTHTKLLSTSNNSQGGLRRTIPKKFPYFHVEWDNGGYAQIIETNSFPKDFATNTIAGMMEIDPVRFNRKPKSVDDDRNNVLEFVKKWKSFDWTFELDEEDCCNN